MSKVSTEITPEDVRIETVPTFEKYIDIISERRAKQEMKAMWVETGWLLIPILGSTYLLLFFVLMAFDPILSICITVMLGFGGLWAGDRYKSSKVDYLRGRHVLDMVFRLRRGKAFHDYALIAHGYPRKIVITQENRDRYPNIPESAVGKNPKLHYYEYVFEDFPYFDKLTCWAPCTEDKLIQYGPGWIIYKGFFVQANVGMVTFGRLRESYYGPEGFVPVVYPIDSDFEIERLQTATGLFSPVKVDKEAAEKGIEIYDTFRYFEAQGRVEALEKAVATKDKQLTDRQDREGKMAASLFEDAATAGTFGKKPKKSKITSIFRNKYVILGIVVAVVVVVLFGGGIFG